MKKPLSLPIRHQMALLITLMALLPLGIIIYTAAEQRNHEIAEAFAITAAVSSQIEDDQNSLIAGMDQLAAAVSVMPAVLQHDTAAVNRLLGQLLRTNPRILEISIMDRSGMAWASGQSVMPHTVTYNDRRFFTNAIKTGSISSGEYTIGKTLQVPIMSFGYPLKDAGGMVTDVMSVVIPLERYSTLYSGSKASPVSSILLTDHRGTILYSSVDSSLIGKRDRPDLFRRMAEGGREGAFEADGNLGIRRLFSYRKLYLKSETSPYLYIRTGLDKDYILSKVRRDLQIRAAMLTPVLLLIFGMAIYISKRGFLDKIYALKDATLRIAAGDLEFRVAGHVSGGELGELAGAFDDMAYRLKQAGENLEESERKYRELVENANSIILKWDNDCRVTFFNEFAERFFGYTSQEIIGRNLVGTIVPETDSSGRNLALMLRTICKDPESFIKNENENTRKNGERVWISWDNHALTAADGSSLGILSIGQDISERKRIELELQKSEQRFRSYVENLNDVIFALTPDGEFSYASPNWTEAFGYELGETIGRSFVPFVHPDDVPVCMKFMKTVFETGQKQSGVEYRVLHKSGDFLWYKANASLIRDPYTDMPVLLGVGRNITGIKVAEETLRQSEEKFASAFHASPDAISLSRLGSGTYLDVNEGFTAMTGYRPEEAVGRTAIELGIWENHQERVKFLLELRETGTMTGREIHFRRKDGSMRTGLMAARIIEINSEPHIMAIIRDVTEHEHLQNELIKAQKLESISVLAGGIAHNFNNVLTGVIGYISYAKKHAEEPGKIREILEAAEKSSYRAAGIARQLLTFSQSGVPARQPVSVDALLRESVDLFLSGTKVQAVFDCTAHQEISVDSQQISQTFNNIVLNALQSMPGGGLLKVATESVTFGVKNRFSLPAGEYVRIDFSDTGSGIAKENLARVYDPYFTTKESGTGLGLSTCHSIIRKHGGQIDITSEPGMGTTVTVLLPAIQEAAGREHSPNVFLNGGCGAKTILFMDDEEVIRNLARELLGGLGYEVTVCAGGKEAVDIYYASRAAGKPYSLAILDLSTRDGMGGVEAARRILDDDPQACLLASSGYTDDPAIADYGAFGFSGAIAKPYDINQLAAALGKALMQCHR